MEKKRINKYLSEVGFCSRRKADEYISAGRVYINGVKSVLGSKVNIDDEISVALGQVLGRWFQNIDQTDGQGGKNRHCQHPGKNIFQTKN